MVIFEQEQKRSEARRIRQRMFDWAEQADSWGCWAHAVTTIICLKMKWKN